MLDSIGEPLDEFNTWEIEWAKEKEERQRHARKERTGPSKAAGRRKVWNKGAGSRKRNRGGQFCSEGDQETRVNSST